MTLEDVIRATRMPYGVGEGYAMPSYSRFVAGATATVFRSTEVETEGQSGLQDAPFADALFDTVDVRRFKSWFTTEEWSLVEVLVDVKAFEARVLLPGWSSLVRDVAPCSSSRLSRKQTEDLIAKGYVKSSRDTRFACSAFAVWKSDGTHSRFIWNGSRFNATCNKPPWFPITPLEVMLSKLLRPGVRFYLSFDFTTWFCQLLCDTEVSKYFGVRLGMGIRHAVRGLPMGFSWACNIAHTITKVIVRRALQALGASEEDIVAEFCIDNVVLAVYGTYEEDAIMKALRAAAKEAGAVFKESAFESGDSVDWLCYRLHCRGADGKPFATLKDSYKVRLQKLAESREPQTVREAWRQAGLVLFTAYAVGCPLWDLKSLVVWLAANVPQSKEGWDNKCPNMTPRAAMLSWSKRHLGDVIYPAPSPSKTFNVWFISDAATSNGGKEVYILVEKDCVTLEVSAARIQGRTSNELELSAHVAGGGEAIKKATEGSTVVGYGDNTSCLSAERRSYALWVEEALEVRMKSMHQERIQKRIYLAAPYVNTTVCVADAWTRTEWIGSKRQRFTCKHELRPGVLCDCTIGILRSWMPDPKGEETLAAWVAQQVPWSPEGE